MSLIQIDLLQQLRSHLHQMHSAFLDSLKYRYQIQKNEPINAYTWFNVLTKDPEFQWIKPFNEIVIDLDILLENSNATTLDAALIRGELNVLFDPQSPSEFAQRFTKILVQDNDLMLHFHHLKSAREALPEDPSQLQHSSETRARWRSENQINSRAAVKKNGPQDN